MSFADLCIANLELRNLVQVGDGWEVHVASMPQGCRRFRDLVKFGSEQDALQVLCVGVAGDLRCHCGQPQRGG